MRTEDILAPLPGITTLKTYVNVTGSCLVQCSDKHDCTCHSLLQKISY